jgi:hypothetical protein
MLHYGMVFEREQQKISKIKIPINFQVSKKKLCLLTPHFVVVKQTIPIGKLCGLLFFPTFNKSHEV